jgi:hypothetical protein
VARAAVGSRSERSRALPNLRALPDPSSGKAPKIRGISEACPPVSMSVGRRWVNPRYTLIAASETAHDWACAHRDEARPVLDDGAEGGAGSRCARCARRAAPITPVGGELDRLDGQRLRLHRRPAPGPPDATVRTPATVRMKRTDPGLHGQALGELGGLDAEVRSWARWRSGRSLSGCRWRSPDAGRTATARVRLPLDDGA